MGKWLARSSKGEWFDCEGPVPRVGDLVALPDDNPRPVKQVSYRATRKFDRATTTNVHVLVVLED